MTLKEIDSILPNGFHYSYLKSIKLDFQESTIMIELDIDFSSPTDNEGKPIE